MAIYFHEKDETAGIKNKTHLKNWLNSIILQEKYRPGQINIIFTTDNFLLELNKKYLSRDYLTDIITFDYTENQIVAGDLFISVPRIKENAMNFDVLFTNELKRVMAHGLLHLLGYEDSNKMKESEMRRLEDKYLKISPEI